MPKAPSGVPMNRQIIVGLTTEGSTDARFLESIIQRSFEDVAFDCKGSFEVLPVQYIERSSGEFVEVVAHCARQAYEQGIMVLCVHSDADDVTDKSTFDHKISPAFSAVYHAQSDALCKTLVAIVPVQMTEAWMLSDKALLKAEIGTNKDDIALGIEKFPEAYRNPKQCIENAIRIARRELTKRRRKDLSIVELYSLIGRKISLSMLEQLPSYRKFRESIWNIYNNLNYVHQKRDV